MRGRQPAATPRPKGPFSRPLKVREVKDDGLRLTIEAKPEECAAVATAIGLPAVASLSVSYAIERRAGGRIEVAGDLRARITQVCVVSLEEFESDVTQAIDLTFAPEAQSERLAERLETRGERHRTAERAPAPVPGSDDQVDPPDPIVDDTIDLGAVAVEFLVLSLDLYPKKPGVQFSDLIGGDEDEQEPSPFAALERLKDRP
jgi:uncharacterized metal-binding protein YceD (DUF177 family)